VGPLPAWTAPRKLSGQFAFHANDEILAIVSWPGASQVSADEGADEALAWGLAYGGDRDVALLLPRGLERPTLQRLPWVRVPVRVFTFAAEPPVDIDLAMIPARAEVLGEIAGWGARGKADLAQLGDVHTSWVQELIAWADANLELAGRHRQSYLAWHCAGRQVLKITPAGPAPTIEAGVRYSKRVHAPLTSEDLVRVQATVEAAIARRIRGEDTGHEEHRLQHAMQSAFNASGVLIGLSQLHREFPAWRPGQSPGYVDFVGATAERVPHLVETKLDNDVMLPLQALDYWICATADPTVLEQKLGPVDGTPVIDFIVGAHKTSKAVGPYTLRQLEALDGAVPWRFHVARDWNTELHIDSLPGRRVPGPPIGWKPAVPPRYAQRLQDHLIETQRTALASDGPFYRSPQGGVLLPARQAWDDLATRGRLHRYAHHARSSQVFALNLFAGLDDAARLRLAALAGIEDVALSDEIVFEFEDLTDRLGEATTASPHRTQVDVMLRCTLIDRSRTMLLIEVKLSELDFGHCSAYQAAANDRRDLCQNDGPFGNDPAFCFQLRNHDREQRRTYDRQLGVTPATHHGCSFRLGPSQPMRNVALGRAYITSNETNAIVHALVAPGANRTIWRRWVEAKAALVGIPGVRLVDLPAENLLVLHDGQRASELAHRYQLKLDNSR